MKPSVAMSFSSPVMTPNGDGRNDEVKISYVVAQFVGKVRVQLSVYDLSGTKVKAVSSGWLSSGKYEPVWDGTDDGGALVPPGVYLCRMSVETDARTFSTLKRIAVVY